MQRTPLSHRTLTRTVALAPLLLLGLATSALLAPHHDLRPGAWTDRETLARLPSDTWPTVDSLSVDCAYYHVDQDTTIVTAFLRNPHPNHTFVFPIQLVVTHAVSDYHYVSPLQEVTLAPGEHLAVDCVWFDPDVTGFLEYDLEIRMVFEEPTRENLLVNGDFEAGLTAWDVANDNPPGYGVEHTTFEDGDPDGEAHVYSTQYNTAGIQPRISQTADGVGTGQVVHLSFAMDTEDILYGTGVGMVYAQRGAGQTVFWHSAAATPPDDATHHYIRVFDSARHDRALTVDQIPGGTGDEVTVGATTYLIAPYGYAMAEIDVYLDDTGIREADFLETTAGAAFVMTTLDTQTIGDYRVALQECADFSSWPEGAETLDLVPMMGTLFVWDNVHRNVCAASIYQDLGDDFRKYTALGLAAYSVLEVPLGMLGQMGYTSVATQAIDAGVVADIVSMVATGLEDVVFEEEPDVLQMCQDLLGLMPEETRTSATVIGDVLLEVAQILEQRDEPAVANADSLQLRDAWAQPLAPGRLSYGYVGPHVRPLDSDEEPSGTADRLVRLTALSVDTLTFAVTNRREGAAPQAVSLENLVVAAGDRLQLALSDSTTQYVCEIDRGGDGTVDEVVPLQPVDLTGVPSHRAPAPPGVAAFPNPFNPSTTLTFTLPAAGTVRCEICDLAGRRLKTLVARHLPAGQHTITWRGDDEHGRALPSGVYVARLETDRGTTHRKLTIVR